MKNIFLALPDKIDSRFIIINLTSANNMGHQSYILYFNTEEEKKQIIDVLNKHNELNKDDDAWEIFEIGMVIECCCIVNINQPYKRGRGANYNYAILCSNGGGRSSTFSYLFKNQIPTEGYNNAFERRAGKTNLKNATPVYLDSDLQYTHNKNFEYVLNELNTRNLKPRD